MKLLKTKYFIYIKNKKYIFRECPLIEPNSEVDSISPEKITIVGGGIMSLTLALFLLEYTNIPIDLTIIEALDKVV